MVQTLTHPNSIIIATICAFGSWSGCGDADIRPPDGVTPSPSGKADTLPQEDSGVGDSDSDGETDERAAINEYIRGLGTPSLPPAIRQKGPTSAPYNNGDYTCTETNLLETKQFDKIVAFAANSHTMYPGSLVGGDSIQTGLFVPRVLPRAPLTISASLEGVLSENVSARLENPSLSAYRDAMREILSANITGNTAANVAFDIAEVHSEEQLSMAAGLDIDWSGGEFESSFNWDDKDQKSRFIVNFVQAYYTVDIDVPSQPADFFADGVTAEEVKQVIHEPPAYVASVTYGRMVSFAVESKFSAAETSSALEFGFGGWVVDVDGSFSLTHTEVLNELKINALILGGDGNAAVESIRGIEGLRNFVQTGGTYSRESPGAPIAYKLSYMADGTPARFSLTTDYTLTECDRIAQNVRVALKHIQVISSNGDNDGLEIYGTVAVVDDHGTRYPLLERPLGNEIHIFQGTQWPQGNAEIAAWIIPMAPLPGRSIVLETALWDRDSGADDVLSNGSIPRRFEDGWRGQWVVPFGHNLLQGNLVLELKPSP